MLVRCAFIQKQVISLLLDRHCNKSFLLQVSNFVQQTDALARIKEQWNKYKEKYLDKGVHEVRYFERNIPIPPSKRILEQPSFRITKYDTVFEIATENKEPAVQEGYEEAKLNQCCCCCSRSVSQQSSNASIRFTRLPKISKDPYSVLNSLTSQQIRRLISTSYNACFKRCSQEQIETASKKLQFSPTLSRSFKPQKEKRLIVEELVQRLLRPTQATLMRNAKKVSTRTI